MLRAKGRSTLFNGNCSSCTPPPLPPQQSLLRDGACNLANHMVQASSTLLVPSDAWGHEGFEWCARLYNLGGPERLSRVEMAETVAKVWGYSTAAIQVRKNAEGSVPKLLTAPNCFSYNLIKNPGGGGGTAVIRFLPYLGHVLPWSGLGERGGESISFLQGVTVAMYNDALHQ